MTIHLNGRHPCRTRRRPPTGVVLRAEPEKM
jgi:hypothetical protein